MIWSDIMLVELSPHTPLPHDVEFNHPGIATRERGVVRVILG
jgi:hypothetical protein